MTDLVTGLARAFANGIAGGRDALRQQGIARAGLTILPPADIDALLDWLLTGMDDTQDTILRWDFALVWLGFDRQSDPAWNDMLFRSLWLPLYKAACDRGLLNLALSLDVPLYMDYVEQREQEQHYLDVYNQVKPCWPAGPLIDKAIHPDGPVCFILHRIARIGHVTIFADFLEGLVRQYGALPFDARLYCLEPGQDAMTQRLAATGITIMTAPEQGAADRLRHIHQDIEEHRGRMTIWLDNPIYLPFACSLPWKIPFLLWAQKFKAFTHDHIDGYLGNGKIFERRRHHNGVDWNIAPNNYSGLDNPAIFAAAEEVRQNLNLPDDTVLVGTLAREQKIASPAFLESLCRVMQRCPHMRYLYTGHEDLPAIRQIFRQAGLLDRVHCAGWVDSAVYAAALDIFADSFPAANGQTLLESMIAGKAAVALVNPDTLESMSVLAMASEALQPGHEARPDMDRLFRLDSDMPLLPLAYSVCEYEIWLERLVNDPRLRRKVGRALRKYVQTWFCDNRVMARQYWQHMQDIEARIQSSGAV